MGKGYLLSSLFSSFVSFISVSPLSFPTSCF
jgi:hypothetical protein